MTKSIVIPLVFMLHQTPTVETDSISVAVTAPVSGSTVSGKILVSADCSDNVVKVEFMRDGVVFATVYRTPTNPPPTRLKYLRASK